MSRSLLLSALAAAMVVTLTGIAQGAMYKWVDEKGVTHYGDQVPGKYAARAGEQMKSSGRGAKPEQAGSTPRSVPVVPDHASKPDRAQTERQRQDNALLATYATETEIDQARDRELRRNSDVLKQASTGLAKSSSAEDKRRLEFLIEQNRQENDAINKKFDAQKARFRELTVERSAAPAPSTQTAQSTSAAPSVQLPR